jgi:hypothetical protein
VALARDTKVSLNRLSQLSDTQLDALHRAYITNVESLVGQLEADPEALGEVVSLHGAALEKLGADARALLPPQTRKRFARQRGKRYSYGALNPHGH